MSFPIFFTGMMMSLSLIVAIGAQNAFVLRQGLRYEHVLPVCLTCAVSDALLIVLGVTGFAKVTAALPWLDPVMRYAGAAFLVWYGARSLCSAFTATEALSAGGATETGALSRTLLACLAITWLNPHVYLDTVVLLGAVSSRFPGAEAMLRPRRYYRLLPLLLRARLWRHVAETAVRAALGLAPTRRHDRGRHVDDHLPPRHGRLRGEAPMYMPEHFPGSRRG